MVYVQAIINDPTQSFFAKRGGGGGGGGVGGYFREIATFMVYIDY